MPSVEDVAKRQSLLGAGGVFVRAAQIADAAALIKLNEEFRKNMLRWQCEDDDAEYPALNFDDVEFILTEEDSQNLLVLCEHKGGAGRRHARIIGYSYAYEEPWTTAGMGKGDKGKGKEKEGTRQKTADDDNSLYIAEVRACLKRNKRKSVCPSVACMNAEGD